MSDKVSREAGSSLPQAGGAVPGPEPDARRAAPRDQVAQVDAILDGATEDAIIALSLDGGVLRWNVGAERITGYAAADVLGHSAELMFTAEDRVAGAFEGELRLAAAAGRAPNERWHLRKNGSRFWASGSMLPLLDGDGGARGFLNTFRDGTAVHGQTERRDLLLGEMSHRISYLLTIVRFVAAQTARHTAEPAEFLAMFNARLAALARSQDVPGTMNGDGARLDELLAQCLAFLGSDAGRVVRAGPAVRLPADIVPMMGLAVHELAANAVKHGALSVPEGWVEVSWALQAGAGGALSVGIIWSELGGPPVQPPGRRGFGSQLLHRGLGQEPGTTVEIDYAEDGVDCRIRTPLWATGEAGRVVANPA